MIQRTLGLLLILTLSMILPSCSQNSPAKEVKQTTTQTTKPSTPSPADPASIVSALQTAGLKDSLGGRGWSRSRAGDGSWISILITPFGDNEVSFFVESSQRHRAELFELEAEFHRPGYAKQQVMALFEECVFTLYPRESESLRNAIRTGSRWNDGGWSLQRNSYGGSGGYGIMFRWSAN
ncbi:MAG: hypothetical protein ACF8GE_07020 [Phycisphaerales bacterium JB043]